MEILKGKEKILEMMKNGELKGFSWEGFTNQENFENSKIKIETGVGHHEIEDILDNAGIKYEINFKKSAEALTVIGLAMSGISNILAIIGIILTLKKQKPSIKVNIIINNEKLEVNEKNKEKIKALLRVLG